LTGVHHKANQAFQLTPIFLLQVGKANPWQIEALKIVTGSEEKAHKPLTEILEEGMKLKLDHTIDVSGMTIGTYQLSMPYAMLSM
jgi:hypothetical protein